MAIRLAPAQASPYRRASTRSTLLLWALPLLYLAVFFFLPLTAIFREGLGGGGLDFLSAETWARVARPLQFSILVASLATLLTVLLGVPGAYLFARYQFPLKNLLRVLTTIPFILPTVVVAASFNALLGPRGLINVALMQVLGLPNPPINFLNTFGAILVGLIFYNTTIVIRMVGAAWMRIDPRLNQAARILGADQRRTFFEVTLPLLRPALLASALLVFLFDFTSFGVVLLLGGPRYATLEVEIYIQALHLLNLPMASLLSLIQLLSTLVLTVLYTRMSAGTIVAVAPRYEDPGV
ncbi:MAG TPA: ABC transporter permease subunit [Anaerolineaceae bacterium]|nr:ABC transporter permease subunit [Anaerolineaceae bacterium]